MISTWLLIHSLIFSECRFKSWTGFFQLFFSFIFFCSPLYYLFVNKKNVYVDLSRRTMLVRSADSTLASPFFLHLTTRLERFFNSLKRSSANSCCGRHQTPLILTLTYININTLITSNRPRASRSSDFEIYLRDYSLY